MDHIHGNDIHYTGRTENIKEKAAILQEGEGHFTKGGMDTLQGEDMDTIQRGDGHYTRLDG